MIIYGINDSSHDAALSVISDGEIVFAGHSERYNKEKQTFRIAPGLLEDALGFGEPDVIAYFEKRFKKRVRRLLHGGNNGAYEHLYSRVHRWMSHVPEVQVGHHRSHAVAGFFTSPFESATIIVVDAVGEKECTSVWIGHGSDVDRKASFSLPTSFGLFYSAFTHLLGLKPGVEEYILMGMAAFGDPARYRKKVRQYFPYWNKQKYSFLSGITDWGELDTDKNARFDIAAAVQECYERNFLDFATYARVMWPSNNLVFMGGCALNCVANTRLLDRWDNVWIMPNPGDAGSSLGAALSVDHSRPTWRGPYLGRDIPGDYPVEEILKNLNSGGISGVAAGRAEFGPRALGNRSLLADPRSMNNHAAVNEIKRREPFRPFAPVVMEEHASDWFDMPAATSPYMQYAVRCKKPTLIPAVTHVDGTSRVQTVNREQHPGLYEVLRQWNDKTGVPILLNTSLNIKNQPLLNDLDDVRAWEMANPSVPVAVP